MMRVSSVGYLPLGLKSHQILVESSMSPAPMRISMWRWYSTKLAKYSGMPVRGSASKIVSR